MKVKICTSIFLFLINSILCENFKKEIILFDFEELSELWEISKIEGNGVKKIEITEEKFLSGKKSQKIEVEFPSTCSIEKPFFKDLSKYQNIFLNTNLPQVCLLGFLCKV